MTDKYASPGDMRLRFGAAEIDGLTDPDGTRLNAALNDARAAIDAALAAAYDLPVPDCPLLRVIACDLARARLYDDDPPKRVLGAASTARKYLRNIVGNTMSLVDADGQVVPRRARGVTAHPASGPVARTLRGGCARGGS